MKKLLIALCLIGITFSVQAKTVIGKVNIQKVLLEVKEAKRIKGKLEKMAKKKQAILKKEENKIKKMQADFQKQSLVMNDKAKAKKEREIQKSIMQIQQKASQFQQEMRSEEEKYKKPILEKIRKIIELVSKKAGVDMTFEVSIAPVIYAKDSKDLTKSVIKSYNRKHK
ncbi:MAG: OmpH family outer membrane protein [Bacteriovoracaceae bacterium]|nr:OmpH family outer membrane protein [Bacteriovoracaceae bacterium]